MFVSAAPSYSSSDGGALFRRRPSFPQSGYDRNPHKTLHDTILQQQRRQTISINPITESEGEDEEDETQNDNISSNRNPSCTVHVSNEDRKTNNYKENPETVLKNDETIANASPKEHLSGSNIQPQCNCSSPTKCNINNNNVDKDHVCSRKESCNEEERQVKRKSRNQKKYSQGTVIINVGGQIFETYRSTLRRLRTPIFHAKDSLKLFYRKASGDYFFDRDPTAFGSILNFLRTGELHIPTNMCGPALQNELDFWGIQEADIARCCWTQYNTWKTQCRSLQKLEHDRKFSTTQQQASEAETETSCWRRRQLKIWTLLQDPDSSKKAKAYAWVSIVFVFVSIFSFCAETHPVFKVKARDVTQFAPLYNIFSLQLVQWSSLTTSPNQNLSTLVNTTEPSTSHSRSPFHLNVSNHRSRRRIKRSIYKPECNCNTRSIFNQFNENTNTNTNKSDDAGDNDLTHPALLIMDVVCLTFFTLEYITRLICSPDKVNFLRAFQNVVDFLAIAPDYVELVFLLSDHHQKEGVEIMEMLFILRILRLFRIFRLIRHVPGLWILLYTLRASFNELMLMCVFLLIGMVVFATLVHFVEPEGIFSNIPVGFWWSVVTMTTVGYGDMYPQSAAGFFIGSCCAIAGLLMIAFTVPIIVSNFVLYYTHVQYGLARRDREIELMREEEESMMGKSRSRMDIEMMGSAASVSPTPVFVKKNSVMGRERSITNVNSGVDCDELPKIKVSWVEQSEIDGSSSDSGKRLNRLLNMPGS